MPLSTSISISITDSNIYPQHSKHRSSEQPSTMSPYSTTYYSVSPRAEPRLERTRGSEPPTYGTYFWRVASDSHDAYRRVRNWSQDCKCNCCPHNLPGSSTSSHRRDSSQRNRTYPYSNDASTEYRRDRVSNTPLSPTPILKGDNYRQESSSRRLSCSPSRTRLHVTDNTHCELGRRHGQEFSISVLLRATAEDVIEALIPNTSRHRIIVHWHSSPGNSGADSEELTYTLPLWEICRYASHLELRSCAKPPGKKRVHWAV